ncbi:MAG: FAD-dependent oxidoreductase [Dehalococcoidales bacterium]|nr:MAG: FAD-dependent oxidoreductase [Dehalococcoidales bacterium]
MQLGFYFDQSRCTGCFACAIACKDWHDVPAGPARWMRLLYQEEGKFPKVFVSHMATPCYHCTETVCAYVCPNEAITKRYEDGIVVVDREKCREEKTCGIISGEGTDLLYAEQEAPCQVSCPVHLHIPAYSALIAKGRFKEALDLIRRRMPLPSVCGRVCLHPCETECRRKDVEEPVAIMDLKGFVVDNVPQEIPDRLPQTQPDSVAIVGSGPAGLAAGYDLIRMGYAVTVFESGPVAGGMLSTAIPEHRLPREVLKRDIDYLEAVGIEIRINTRVDLGRGLDDLLNKGYGVVLLALGASKGEKLDISGADLKGTLAGVSFMQDIKSGKTTELGEKVLVIGGGNVAIDCARSARRLGANTVHVACLECREDMPAEDSEIKQAEEEGIEIHCSLTSSRVLENNGKVAGVECQEIEGLQFDENGQPSFEVVKDTGHVFDVDTVIFAIGQVPDLSGLSGDIKTSPTGTIAADSETFVTARRGIFSAGDVMNGPTSVVDAIASGQKAAFFINRHLQGDVLQVQPEKTIDPKDITVDIPADVEKRPRQLMPTLPVNERLSSFKEVALGFSEAEAIKEAERCLNCAGHLCKDACPYSSPQFADEEKARMQKCDLCIERWADGKKPICVEACPPHALDAGIIDELKVKYGEVTEAHNFNYSRIIQPSIITKPKQR